MPPYVVVRPFREAFLYKVWADKDNVVRKAGHMNRIAIYREKAGMSIQELADKVHVHVGYLKQVESGYYQASTKLLARIANQLGVPIKDLLCEIKEVAQ